MDFAKIILYVGVLQMASTLSQLYSVPVNIWLRPENAVSSLVTFGISLVICLKFNPIAEEIWQKWKNK